MAITVTWALYELVRHPDILRQLREEVFQRYVVLTRPASSTHSQVYSTGPDGASTPSQLDGMELLNGVLQETMRLHASGMDNIPAQSRQIPLTLSSSSWLQHTYRAKGLFTAYRRWSQGLIPNRNPCRLTSW